MAVGGAWVESGDGGGLMSLLGVFHWAPTAGNMRCLAEGRGKFFTSGPQCTMTWRRWMELWLGDISIAILIAIKIGTILMIS